MYFEYGGGLGDVLMRCYRHYSYRKLASLTDRARVVLCCHNPHVQEFFDLHPNRHLMDLEVLPYWTPADDGANRAKYGLPPLTNIPGPCDTSGMDYYVSDQDWDALSEIGIRPYVAIFPSAGLPNRNVPAEWVVCWVEMCLRSGFTPVLLGRSYDRHGRLEAFAGHQQDGLVNLINRLSAPASFLALRGAVGVCSAHSSSAAVAWEEKKPLLLAYPEETRVFHFLREDQWSFGMNRDDTFQACTTDPDGVAYAATNFFAHLNWLAECCPGVPSLPYPLKAAAFPLKFQGQRWTSEHDTRLLLHQFSSLPPGNILELGCSYGATTFELASAFPGRTIYAVDSGEIRTGLQQAGHRINPRDFCCHARHLPNVVPVYSCSSKLDLSAFQNVVGVFVDGDHTYSGVFRDAALCDRIRPKVAAYHDCYYGQPAWVGVNKVLADRHDRFRVVHHVAGSWLAFETY